MKTSKEIQDLAEKASEEVLRAQLYFSEKQKSSPLWGNEDHTFHRLVIKIVSAELKKRKEAGLGRS